MLSVSMEHLKPHQLGVGVKGGAEATIHAASAIFHDDSIDDEKKWVLQIDFEDAFNLINRARMLEEIRKYCPKAAKWANTCYGASSHLFFGDHRLSSSSGAQKGDPLASLKKLTFKRLSISSPTRAHHSASTSTPPNRPSGAEMTSLLKSMQLIP